MKSIQKFLQESRNQDPYGLWFKNKVSEKWSRYISWTNASDFNAIKNCDNIKGIGDNYNEDQKYLKRPVGWTEWKITFKGKDISKTYCSQVKSDRSKVLSFLKQIGRKIHPSVIKFIKNNKNNKNIKSFDSISKKWVSFKFLKGGFLEEMYGFKADVIKKGFIPFATDYTQGLYAININDTTPKIYYIHDMDDMDEFIIQFEKRIGKPPKEYMEFYFNEFIKTKLKGIRK